MRGVMPHAITGDRDEVAAALRQAAAEGRLVTVIDRCPLPGGRVRVVAELCSGVARTRWTQARPRLLIAGRVVGALAVVGGVAGVVWLVVTAVLSLVAALAALVALVVAWVQAHWGWLLAAGLGALWLLARSGVTACPGLHCGGCRR